MTGRAADSPGMAHSGLFGVVDPQAGWYPPLRYLLRRRRILRLLSGLPPGRLLEVGCGAGALLDDFAGVGHQAVGFETSARALGIAQALAAGQGARYSVVDRPLPEWRGAFDLVCAFDVLEHIEHDGEALAQWLSWLKPGGAICLSVPAHRRRWGAGDAWAGHYRRYDRRDLQALVEHHGGVIDHFECYGFPLANLSEWAGERTYRRRMAERSRQASRAEATAESGIDRRDAGALFRWLDTFPGRALLRLALLAQAAFAGTDLGSGYLVLARKA